jgi:amino acid transporter
MGNLNCAYSSGAEWASEPVWKDVENLAATGFEPQTVQPVACNCIVCAISSTIIVVVVVVIIIIIIIIIIIYFSHDATAPSGPGHPPYRGFTITHRHTTIGRSLVDK